MAGWVKEIPNRQARQGLRLSQKLSRPRFYLDSWFWERVFCRQRGNRPFMSFRREAALRAEVFRQVDQPVNLR
jgi:hypothetical protein